MNVLKISHQKIKTHNPTGDVNAYRIIQTQQAESKLETKGQTFYIQDSVTIDDLTLNVGLRAERWEHLHQQAQASSHLIGILLTV
ncbi:hypothetical protein RT723_03055 [Psychrosphaera aquimarina]|uniref:Uncharacterized protein n=1 Tax=Psychrosphaera aquimarina TaxID=2044854 RepID=A0ABU3QX33_9GAMM|nr:hypothetical protein [Psychrosphaera aquimarina]MDU0111996.1 hypothetical protein [Psychrosphaera aquimarina]